MNKTKIIVVEDNIVYCEYVCQPYYFHSLIQHGSHGMA